MERLAAGFGLLEGPTWHSRLGLIFSDVDNGGVFSLGAGGEIETLVEHRRGIGGIALHADGGLVVGGRNIAHKRGDETLVLLGQDSVDGIVGFNDLTTDALGRIYVGSLGASPFAEDAGQTTGYLHRIDLDGSTHVLAAEIKLTNGLGFSPDGSRLYHADTMNQFIGVYEVDAETGDVGPRRRFANIADAGGPDGLAVAEDGSVWCALAMGGCVAVFDASGKLREQLPVPHPLPTSVCFGGDDRRDLYVVTGAPSEGGDTTGSIFRTRVEVAGLPVAPARVRRAGA